MNNNTSREAEANESTGLFVYKRDKQMNDIQQKLEDNRKKMFEKRLALKKYAKTHGSDHHVNEIIKKYDEYYHEYKTNIKLQIRALEEIIKHLDDVLEEQYQNDDLDAEELVSRNKMNIKKDKMAIVKEVKSLKKLMVL
jgi:type I site-specific restriction-modification system R (restriction) subunit